MSSYYEVNFGTRGRANDFYLPSVPHPAAGVGTKRRRTTGLLVPIKKQVATGLMTQSHEN